jgi:trk system potassium uptake protein TrkH
MSLATHSQSLPVSAKISAASSIMTLGRLEVMIVFAVLNIRYWMSR